jgi:hypothetical protein
MPFGPHRGACPAGRAALCQSVLVQNYAASALAVTRFNHRQIHSDRVARQRHSVRQVPRLEQSRNPGPEMEPFTPVEAPFRASVTPRSSPPDLHDHQSYRWAGVDGNDIKLASTGMDVASQQLPPPPSEQRSDPLLGRITGSLSARPRASFRHSTTPDRQCYPNDSRSSASTTPAGGSSHKAICRRLRQGAKERRCIGLKPSASRPARCSGAA